MSQAQDVLDMAMARARGMIEGELEAAAGELTDNSERVEYLVRVANSHRAGWSGGHVSSSNIFETMTRDAAIRLADQYTGLLRKASA
jgi:uncharacterized protein YeeX (DUF496 family)